MTHSNRALASAIALAALVPLLATPVGADPLLDEGITVSLGSFAMDTTTVFRIDGTSSTGDEVDAERDLGLTDQSRFRFDMTWRFAENHKLRALWFNNDRTAQRVLDRTITIGDDTYPIGTTVTTTLNTDILELAYEYAFWREDDWEITGSAGLHTVTFFYDVDGLTDTPAEADATGPLPVFGARGQWRYGDAWYLEAQAQFFGLEFGGFKGRLDDYKASVTYMFGDHLGVGAGWNQFTMRISSTDSDFDGIFQWRYGGPMLFLTGAF
jgi:hypothetical protein